MARDGFALRSPLGRARGLGSARTGGNHWWHHRLSMAANVPLAIWFAISVSLLAGQPYEVVRAWFSSPFTAVALIFTVFNFAYHAKMDLQLVLEDYLSNKTTRLVMMALVYGAIWISCALSLFSIFKLSLG